jgi:hypothetical protein
MEPHRGILIHRIPVEGAGGLIFALGMVLIALVGIPALRPLAALSLLAGVAAAPVLYWLHRP